jgi:DNA-binding PadR family transcriptional regulator
MASARIKCGQFLRPGACATRSSRPICSPIRPGIFCSICWRRAWKTAAFQFSSLCIAASVPPTTALRWIRQLTDRGLLDRQADPKDGRRIYITLSEAGMEAILRWFEESRTHLHTASKTFRKPRPGVIYPQWRKTT